MSLHELTNPLQEVTEERNELLLRVAELEEDNERQFYIILDQKEEIEQLKDKHLVRRILNELLGLIKDLRESSKDFREEFRYFRMKRNSAKGRLF